MFNCRSINHRSINHWSINHWSINHWSINHWIPGRASLARNDNFCFWDNDYDEETLDEILNGRLRVFQKKRGYRFSVDAILLAHFVSLKSKSKAIDLGTGSGIIPLILATRFPHVSWTGLEIQAELAGLADKSVQLNGLQEHITIVNGDARKIKNIFPAHSFDAVTFNPPYRKINSGRINPGRGKSDCPP